MEQCAAPGESLAAALAPGPDLPGRLHALLAWLAQHIPASGAAIYGVEDGQRLRLLARLATDPDVALPDPEHPAMARVLGTGARVQLEVDGVPWLGLPLVAAEQTLGVCVLASTHASFSLAQVALAEAAASAASLMLDRERLIEAQAQTQAHVRGLSARLTELEEGTRQRLSADLHDRAGESLTALGINLSLVHSQLEVTGQASLAARVERCLELAEAMSQQVRHVMAELRPPVLDDYGLFAALGWYADRYTGYTGIEVRVEGAALPERLPLIVETALFRITQEALTNVTKHAHAQRATVTLEATDDGARLVVADDGVGFSPQRPRGLGERPRWGLITMRGRAESVGAVMRIESAPGQGTRVIIEVAR